MTVSTDRIPPAIQASRFCSITRAMTGLHSRRLYPRAPEFVIYFMSGWSLVGVMLRILVAQQLA